MDSGDYITMLVALAAIGISILNFRRGRRLENENYLFQKKLDAYGMILGEVDKLLWFLYDAVLKHEKKHLYPGINWDTYADEIDEKTLEFGSLLIENSLLMSEGVYEALDDLEIKLYQLDTEKKLEDPKAFFASLYKMGDKVSDLMREDLNLDTLHSSLYSRLSDDKLSNPVSFAARLLSKKT